MVHVNTAPLLFSRKARGACYLQSVLFMRQEVIEGPSQPDTTALTPPLVFSFYDHKLLHAAIEGEAKTDIRSYLIIRYAASAHVHLERGDADLERGLRRGGGLARGRSSRGPLRRAGRSLSGDLLRCLLAAKPRPWPWPILIASTGATIPCQA